MRDMESLPDAFDCVDCGRAVSLAAESCGCGNDMDPLERVGRAALEHLEHGEKAVIPEEITGHPVESGYRMSRLGRRRGQNHDYRLKASELRDDDNRELHIREYDDRRTIHVDRHPARHPRHAVDDAPEVGVAAGVAAFAAVGLTAAASVLRNRRDS